MAHDSHDEHSGGGATTTHPDEVFNAARRLANPAERGAYLDRACAADAGLRQRVEALLAAREPISAEEIADGLGGRMTQSDLASVYRNLETLGELGLVRHFHAGHGPGRYVLVGFGDREYLACESCGALQSVEPAALDGVRDAVRHLSGFEARFSHFPIVGLCARCAKERNGREAAGGA